MYFFSISVIPKRVFVKNPKDLLGEIFSTRLLKGERGLGFTIIGGDLPDTEFLQIKNVVLNGPAFVDGKLQTGNDSSIVKFFTLTLSLIQTLSDASAAEVLENIVTKQAIFPFATMFSTLSHRLSI